MASNNSPPQSRSGTKVRLGVNNGGSTAPVIQTDHDYDIVRGLTDSRGTGSADWLGGSMLSPTDSASLSPVKQHNGRGQHTPQSASSDGSEFANFEPNSAGGTVTNPFNFTPVQYTLGGGNGTMVRDPELVSKRRGHQYRHSSIHVSAMDQIFQAPASARTPLTVPSSLPMPTYVEAWRSMDRSQTARLAWSFCHILVAGYVQFSGSGSLAVATLSRLLFFDAAGAVGCVAVDVMGNFEVWRRSSIKHPFGLERADVAAGFGMAVVLGFMALNIISHGIKHSLENVGHHESHSPHSHKRVTAGNIDVASLLSIASTLVSALLLGNHVRIGKAMRFALIARWGKVLGNPSHFLTLSCSLALLLLPLLSPDYYGVFDKILAFTIATLMIALAVRLASSLAPILMMSYKPWAGDPLAVRDVIDGLARVDSAVTHVDDTRFWQVHYGLCIATIKLRYTVTQQGVNADVLRIQQKATELVLQRLGSADGAKWEVSVDCRQDKD